MTAPPRPWSILDSVRRWYRNWNAAREGAFELQSLVSHPDERELLAKRMAGVHLEPRAVAQSDPSTSRDLQRVCAMCGFKYRCARDLAVEALDPSWQQWRDYCPNAA